MVTDRVKYELLSDQIIRWERTYYVESVNYSIGKDIQDEGMVKSATEGMRNCKIAMDTLTKIQGDLNWKPEEEDDSE